MTQLLPGPARGAGRLAAGLTLGTLVWAGLVHHGIGPAFRGSSWLEPSSFLLGDVPDTLLPALALLVLPPLALTVAIYFLTRSSLTRTLAGTATLASACFVFYGVEASGVWRFFHWRWSASIVLFAAVVGAALHAPLLAAAWQRLGWPLRLASYLPVFAFLVGYETHVTGTNPDLTLALSPWPVVQMLGLEFAASWLAALWVGVGLGLLGFARGARLAALGALAAGSLQLIALASAAESGVLLFRPTADHYGAAALLGFLALAVSVAWPPRDAATRAARGRNVLLGGALLAVPLVTGQTLTLLDYTETRDRRAQQIIDALAAYDEQHAAYPADLQQLVAAGILDEVPVPRIGLFSAQEFVYQDFGDSYLLEFSAPRWIQCAYNPPWRLEPGEVLDPEDAEALSGAWSCPRKPPEIW